MENRILVDVQHLSKQYKNRLEPAVDDLSLQIMEGEIFGLLGPNGAGKTTTISILCGLIPATSGEVVINGLCVEDDLKELKLEIGVVFQDIALYDRLSAVENLQYFGSLYGIPKRELNDRIISYLTRLGLEKFKDEKVGSYSGGMKRRINLLAAVLHSPKLLFLDEPAVGVDVHSRNVILDFLNELNASGTSMIYTSHMMDEAERFCSRIAIIDYGKIVVTDTPQNLIAQHADCKNLEEVFLKLTGHQLRD